MAGAEIFFKFKTISFILYILKKADTKLDSKEVKQNNREF